MKRLKELLLLKNEAIGLPALIKKYWPQIKI